MKHCGLQVWDERICERIALPPPITSLVVPNDQHFTLVGPQNSWNAQPASFDGEDDWIALEVRPGERPVGDHINVDRIGFDGFIDPFPTDISNYEITLTFSFVPGENALAGQSGDWLDFAEIHAFPNTGDAIQPSGPITLTLEWSDGLQGNVFRVNRNDYTEVAGSLTAVTQNILYTTVNIAQGTRYDFIVVARAHPTLGYINVWNNGTQVVNYTGTVGYGNRRLYPEFRLYRNARTDITQALMKIESVTAVSIP